MEANKPAPEQAKLSGEQIREVPCIKCNAKPGERCRDLQNITIIGYHQLRVMLRQQQPNVDFPKELDASDKALIVFYAYTMLCDSVAANSTKMFGSSFDTVEIQRRFAQEAVKKLKEEGLLNGTLSIASEKCEENSN